MKVAKRIIAVTLLAGGIVAASLCGCSSKSIVSIDKLYSSVDEDVYRITYNDGTTSEFTVGNTDVSSPITVSDLYEEYKNRYGEDISYDEFLQKYLGSEADSTAVVQDCLRSSVSVYAEFTATEPVYNIFGRPSGFETVGVLQMGSGVIYKMDEDNTYIVTNYHVVYGEDTNEEFSDNMHIYLYGSESYPTDATDGSSGFVYDSYAIDCDYVGGSVDHDIAVLRADTADIMLINDNVKQISAADGYSVGQTAIAIGNMGGYGISATKGIVSVDNEYISLEIGGVKRSYRSVRIDTAIYEGNSGGGLFDSNGRLIGITNSGAAEEQNVNYAIPVQIVTGAADNILYNASLGYDTVRKPTLGITVQSLNARNSYDAVTNTSSIVEDVRITDVSVMSIASSMGLKKGDIIKEFVINDTAYAIDRQFTISDLLLTLREGDVISMNVKRDGSVVASSTYTITLSSLA